MPCLHDLVEVVELGRCNITNPWLRRLRSDRDLDMFAGRRSWRFFLVVVWCEEISQYNRDPGQLEIIVVVDVEIIGFLAPSTTTTFPFVVQNFIPEIPPKAYSEIHFLGRVIFLNDDFRTFFEHLAGS